MLNVYIQAVRERQSMIESYLVPTLEGRSDLFSLVYVSYDERREGPAINFAKILELASSSDSPCLILQDDAVLHNQFFDHLPDIVSRLEEVGAVSLFCPPRKPFREAMEKGHSWVANYRHLWQPGVMLTSEFAKGMLERSRRDDVEVNPKYDEGIISGFLKERKAAIWVTIPSLIQHNINVPSAIGTNKSLPFVGLRVTRVWANQIQDGHYKNIQEYTTAR